MLISALSSTLQMPLLQVEVNDTTLLILGIISLATGVLIFAVPRILNYLVALYLVVIGVLWIIAAL